MKKILLHLGLPKTATTSLQHNVLRKLHQQGVVNFLGKDLDYSDKTGKVIVNNYSGEFIRDAAEERITILDARELLQKYLVEDKLNVFSDEGIMVAYPGMDNLPLERKFENLKKLLEGYEVKVAITLRNPIDYFYSLYVQLYPDFYSHIRELNSFEKYSKKLLKEKENIIFESFFYDSYLPYLKKNFTLEISSFEDLKSDKLEFYKSWSSLLGITESKFLELFEQKHINQKQKTKSGSRKVFSLKFIESISRNALGRFPFIYDFFKVTYNLSGMKFILNRRFLFNSVHKKPEGEQLNKLNVLFNTAEYRK